MSDPTERTTPPTAADGGLREGRTDGLGNFSRMRHDASAGAELAGGISDEVAPSTPSGPDPFDFDDAYPHGAELAGPLGSPSPPDR
jgi:hypothetical protein